MSAARPASSAASTLAPPSAIESEAYLVRGRAWVRARGQGRG